MIHTEGPTSKLAFVDPNGLILDQYTQLEGNGAIFIQNFLQISDPLIFSRTSVTIATQNTSSVILPNSLVVTRSAFLLLGVQMVASQSIHKYSICYLIIFGFQSSALVCLTSFRYYCEWTQCITVLVRSQSILVSELDGNGFSQCGCGD